MRRARHERLQFVQRPPGRATLRFEHIPSPLSHVLPFGIRVQQGEQRSAQLVRSHHTNGIAEAKYIDDIAKVLGVLSDKNWNAMLRRLDNIVPAARDQA